jgi:hypothetical protein
VAFGCAQKHPPYALDSAPNVTEGGQAGGLELGGQSSMPSGPCGAQSIPAVSHPPNISFVIDHSGSMGNDFAGSGLSKYENARLALQRVLKAVGHRINYGATIFPGLDGATGCEPGDELMKVAPGDPPSYARAGKTGPRLRDLLTRLSIADVEGGTPVAATLQQSLTTLGSLPGTTYVVLITDGAPNCNAELMCEASACIPSIERLQVDGFDCSDVNCCAPTRQNPTANESCVDEQATVDAVQALSNAGISTFVVGMPGSEPYERLLNRMADVGGTARTGATKYYPVTDTAALEKSLIGIAASVAISCQIPLDYAPPDPDFVNVYFDDVLVQSDPDDGWQWTADGQVAIRGAACEELRAGDVLEVEVLAGCKTVVK